VLSELLDQVGLTVRDAVWGVVIFVALFVGSIAVVVAILVHMPADYFVDKKEGRTPAVRRSAWGWALVLGKNLLGLVLLVVGGVMLFSPGQGVLTLLIGVMLLDFPGKRRLEHKLVSRPRVLSSINRVRAYFRKPPLRLEGETLGGRP
jgi:hypothetical protein